ncbi:hypothetical protein [Paenibacillus antarcticus]|nr:hypothetical protein [Paenibacillus antarcticus]
MNRLIKRKALPKITQVQNPGFEDSSFSPWHDVGDVFLSTIQPNFGKQHARYEVPPGRSASLSQLVFLSKPGSTNSYKLIFSVNSQSNSGILQISLLGTLVSGITIPLKDIPKSKYKYYTLTFPSSALRGSSSFVLEFRVNGTGSRTAILNLDTAVVIPV